MSAVDRFLMNLNAIENNKMYKRQVDMNNSIKALGAILLRVHSE